MDEHSSPHISASTIRSTSCANLTCGSIPGLPCSSSHRLKKIDLGWPRERTGQTQQSLSSSSPGERMLFLRTPERCASHRWRSQKSSSGLSLWTMRQIHSTYSFAYPQSRLASRFPRTSFFCCPGRSAPQPLLPSAQEVFSTTWRLVVKQDAVVDPHPIAFAVASGDVEGVGLGATIGDRG